jgi:hypothetical protein
MAYTSLLDEQADVNTAQHDAIPLLSEIRIRRNEPAFYIGCILLVEFS